MPVAVLVTLPLVVLPSLSRRRFSASATVGKFSFTLYSLLPTLNSSAPVDLALATAPLKALPSSVSCLRLPRNAVSEGPFIRSTA